MSHRAFAIVATIMLCLVAFVSVDAQDWSPGDQIFVETFEDDAAFASHDQRVANGWQPWNMPDSDRPEYRQADPRGTRGTYELRVFSGENAQQYFTFYRVHDAGLLRTVPVPPYAKIKVSAYGHAWSTATDDGYQNDGAQHMHMRVGVDVTGNTNPQAPTVVWSSEINPLGRWQQTPPVEVTNDAEQAVTVFLRSAPMYALKHNDVYWDEVVVTYEGAGVPPAPTAAPASGGGGGNGDAASGDGGYTPVSMAAAPDPVLDGLVEQQVQGNSGGAPPAAIAGAAALLLVCTAAMVYTRSKQRDKGVE
jgi:hypothetical protein